MINLLPPKDKSTIRKEFLRRYFNVVGLGVLLLIFVEVIFSFILFFFVGSFSKSVEDQLETTKNVANSKNLEEMETKINGINGFLSAIEEEKNSVSDITGNIERILDILPESISLESFSFEPQKILIGGHSEKRGDLLDFTEDLEKIDCAGVRCFLKATLPVSNLLQEKDFDFSLTVDLN